MEARARATANMVLPTPGGPMNNTLVASSRKRRVARFIHQLLVDRRLGIEVEVLKPERRGQGGEALQAGPPADLGGGDLHLQEPLQKGSVAELLGGGVLELGRKGLSGGGHAQIGEVAAGFLIDGVVAHRVPSTRSA
jgi:hypothetical protein